MCIAPNALIFRQSKANNLSTPDYILMKLHMHHYSMVINKVHEIPSIACLLMAEDRKTHLHSESQRAITPLPRKY